MLQLMKTLNKLLNIHTQENLVALFQLAVFKIKKKIIFLKLKKKIYVFEF